MNLYWHATMLINTQTFIASLVIVLLWMGLIIIMFSFRFQIDPKVAFPRRPNQTSQPKVDYILSFLPSPFLCFPHSNGLILNSFTWKGRERRCWSYFMQFFMVFQYSYSFGCCVLGSTSCLKERRKIWRVVTDGKIFMRIRSVRKICDVGISCINSKIFKGHTMYKEDTHSDTLYQYIIIRKVGYYINGYYHHKQGST